MRVDTVARARCICRTHTVHLSASVVCIQRICRMQTVHLFPMHSSTEPRTFETGINPKHPTSRNAVVSPTVWTQTLLIMGLGLGSGKGGGILLPTETPPVFEPSMPLASPRTSAGGAGGLNGMSVGCPLICEAVCESRQNHSNLPVAGLDPRAGGGEASMGRT